MLQLIIQQDLAQVRAYANDMLSHVDESLWFRQPSEGINHVAWQVGHMAVSQYSLCLKRIRGVSESDEHLEMDEFGPLFGKGSQPSPSEHDYPTPAEIRSIFGAVFAMVMDESADWSPELLDESAGPRHPMFATKGQSLRFSAKHEMLHVGQIGLLRRQLGCTFLR